MDPIRLNNLRFEALRLYQEAENFYLQLPEPNFGMRFLVFNQNPGQGSENRKPFVEPGTLVGFRTQAFREAASHSTDRESTIREVHRGHGFRQWAYISRGHLHY